VWSRDPGPGTRDPGGDGFPDRAEPWSVIPAKAGIHSDFAPSSRLTSQIKVDPGFRRDDKQPRREARTSPGPGSRVPGPGFFAALLLLAMTLLAPAFAAAAPRIGLLTMAPGAEYWARFGHNAILVVEADGTSTSYNFGYFDFEQENFFLRFIRGEMLYQLVALPAEVISMLVISLNAFLPVALLLVPVAVIASCSDIASPY